MELTGKIIAVLPQRSGTSNRTGSEWRVGSYVLETMDQYPRKLAFDVFGVDRIAQFNLQAGEIVTVFFDIDAHEYQGRWFNSIRAFRVDKNPQAAPVPGVNPTQPSSVSAAAAAPAQQGNAQETSYESADDLPF